MNKVLNVQIFLNVVNMLSHAMLGVITMVPKFEHSVKLWPQLFAISDDYSIKSGFYRRE